jgi:hypothetical protein
MIWQDGYRDKKLEFEFGSFLLAYALEREDIMVEKTKGEMMSLQAQVPQHTNEQKQEF